MKNISNLRQIYEDKARRTDSVTNTEKSTEEEVPLQFDCTWCEYMMENLKF